MESKEDFSKKEYEISFLLKNENSGKDILDSLKRNQFEVILDNPVKKITLAYKIKKEDQAYFGFIHFGGDPANLSHVNEEFKNKAEVLRFLIITPPFTKPKVSLQSRPTATKISREKSIPAEVKSNLPLSNEDIEKKIEEILK